MFIPLIDLRVNCWFVVLCYCLIPDNCLMGTVEVEPVLCCLRFSPNCLKGTYPFDSAFFLKIFFGDVIHALFCYIFVA